MAMDSPRWLEKRLFDSVRAPNHPLNLTVCGTVANVGLLEKIKMKHRIRIVFLPIIFFLYGTSSLINSETKLESLSRFKPQGIKKEFKSMGISYKDAFQIDKGKYVLSGVDDKKDNENDYGIRLFVIEGNKVIFRSKGMMDSWYLNLTFFRLKASNNKILILGEGGDEGGSYGFAVYELKNSQVKDMGYINASIWDNSENILSAVPFLEIAENTDGYIFTFTRDVTVQDEKTYKYKTINKQSIKYIYDGKGDIKEIIE